MSGRDRALASAASDGAIRIVRVGASHAAVLAAVHRRCFAMSGRDRALASAASDGAIRIVRVGASHAAVLAAVHRRCFAEAWSEAEMAALLDTGVFALVALDAEEPVGSALARVVCEEGEILALGVVAEHRRRSIATKLLAALVAEAGVRGAIRLVLEVAADNRAAQILYARTGFAPVGRRRGYYARPNHTPADALIFESAHIRPCAGATDGGRADPSPAASPLPPKQ